VGPSVAGAWEHFPPNNISIDDIPKPDIIYISHIHSDHCEEETLLSLDTKTPVLIIDRDPNFLEAYLKRHFYRNIIKIPEGQLINVGYDLRVETFGATFDHPGAQFIDSSILFLKNDSCILNCNDNEPNHDFCIDIASRYLNIDLAMLPANAAGAYPAMYTNLDKDERIEIIKEIQIDTASKFTRAVDVLKPNIAIPVAGGYAIRGPLAERVNWDQPRRTNMMDLKTYYNRHGRSESQILPMQCGMEVDLKTGKIKGGNYHVFNNDELADYYRELSKRPIKRVINTTRPIKSFSGLLKIARKNMWGRQTQVDKFLEYTIYLDINTENNLFRIRLDTPEIHEVERGKIVTGQYLKLSLDHDTMLEWLLGYEDFNMLDSGHRIEFFREPNEYHADAYLVLSFLRI